MKDLTGWLFQYANAEFVNYSALNIRVWRPGDQIGVRMFLKNGMFINGALHSVIQTQQGGTVTLNGCCDIYKAHEISSLELQKGPEIYTIARFKDDAQFDQ